MGMYGVAAGTLSTCQFILRKRVQAVEKVDLRDT